jgi:hypothetical protein
MARKMNAVKSSQEMRGQAEGTNRRLAASLTHYLPQPHVPAMKITPPRRRLQIAIEVEMRPETPGPVKIIHTV